MKLAILDIEVSPAVATIWDLKTRYVQPHNIRERRRVICMAWKWLSVPETHFISEWDHGRKGMLGAAWQLLDEADGVITYNGTAFDLPMLNTEFMIEDMPPPSPAVSTDLMKVAKKNARFMSGKLDYISGQLGLGHKLDTGGIGTWAKVLEGDEEARQRFQLYNEMDVELTERLYFRLLPWAGQHPSPGVIDCDDGCPRCSGGLRPRGWAYTKTSKYRRYRCDDCGGWSRSVRREGSAPITAM